MTNLLPIERLKKGTPALRAEEDVYTNHIHADDLAQIIFSAIYKAAPSRVYHAVDDSELKMADYFDLVADRLKLLRPPRVNRVAAQSQLPKELLSFMGESRRLCNRRLRQELGVKLRYPTVREGVAAAIRNL